MATVNESGLCYCGGYTNVFCRIMQRVNSRRQAYTSVPIRDDSDVEIWTVCGYDFRELDNCVFRDRTLDGINSLELIVRVCNECGELSIAGFATQLGWTERADGTGVFAEHHCKCGALIVVVFDYK